MLCNIKGDFDNYVLCAMRKEDLRVLCDRKGGFEGSLQSGRGFWEFCVTWNEILKVLWNMKRSFWEFCATWKEVLRVLCDMKGFITFMQNETRFSEFWEIWNVIPKVHRGVSCTKITCLSRSMVLRDCNDHFFNSRLT